MGLLDFLFNRRYPEELIGIKQEVDLLQGNVRSVPGQINYMLKNGESTGLDGLSNSMKSTVIRLADLRRSLTGKRRLVSNQEDFESAKAVLLQRIYDISAEANTHSMVAKQTKMALPTIQRPRKN